MVDRACGRVVRRPGDHALAAPVRVVARYGVAGRPAAVALLRRATPASGAAAGRLARLAVALDEPVIAANLLAIHPDAGGDGAAPLRAQVAFATGNYAVAVREAASALARHDDRGLRRLAARACAELAVLDPAWGPVPPIGRRRVAGDPGRVLHLLTNSLPERQAGYTLRAHQVARCQAAVGLDPQMATRAGYPGVEGTGRTPLVETVDGIAYHRIDPDLAPGMPVDELASRTAHGLARLVDALRPAVLHPTTNYVNAQAALAVGAAKGLPVVYEVRGFLEETWVSRMGQAVMAGDRYVAARAMETDAMRRAAAVVTLSETMRAAIVARGGIDQDRVRVIPNAVDIDAFRPGPRDEALAASLGIEPGEPVVGYISSFAPYEGIRFLIEAVATLRARGRRVRLVLVGDGDELPALRAVAQRTGLTRSGGVVFTGRVPHADIARFYRLIDVFVVPRTADRVSELVTPLKPYEAMAMARALVVSRVGALLEIVRDGETGVTFTPEDQVALADALEPLLDDPRLRARLGDAARGWVAAHRTWAANGERYRELYRELGVG